MARAMTDLYLATVETAVANPGHWVEVQRRFVSEMNASVTGHCLKGGYLRVEPRGGEASVVVNGKTFLRTAAPVDVKIDGSGTEWKLYLRFAR